MERLMIIWEELGDWFDANFDKPMFQMAQGIILGMVLALCIWLTVKGLKGGRHGGTD